MGVMRISDDVIWGSSSGFLYALLEDLARRSDDERFKSRIELVLKGYCAYFDFAGLPKHEKAIVRHLLPAIIEDYIPTPVPIPAEVKARATAMLRDLYAKVRDSEPGW